MAVRLFGGWGFDDSLCADSDFARAGYAQGVPMGGDLPPYVTDAKGPAFAVHALRDPGTLARPGGLLQRAQIVKGWLAKDGTFRQAIYEIAGDPPTGARIESTTCEPRGPGAASLYGVWRDPDFDPERAAVYSARVFENPNCRYTTRSCRNASPADRPARCVRRPHSRDDSRASLDLSNLVRADAFGRLSRDLWVSSQC